MDKKQELLFELLKIIDIDISKKEDLINIVIDQNSLKQQHIIEKYYKLIPELKKKYNSEMLTCLHKNSLKKQKFPAVNTLRQILKCNKLKLKPYVVSNGYDKSIGKKLVERKYVINYLE